uniref:Large ribosomal subunit protein bL28m n=1 Tax=Suricata suricatta TaxID=37032 RepID=A0A673TNI9_SURSU
MPLHKVPVGLWKQLRLREGICSRLPRHYLRSLEQARTPTPVHYRPHGVKFKINPKNGQRERVEDVPIPIYYPPESQLGLWGGEGWVLGHRYINNDKLSKRVKKVWKPQLFQRQLYSEILDTKFTVTVTMRTLDLIDEAYGFDFYILKAGGGSWPHAPCAPGPDPPSRHPTPPHPTPDWPHEFMDRTTLGGTFGLFGRQHLPACGLPVTELRFFFFFNNVYFIENEKQRKSMSREGAEREGDRI